MKLVTSKTSNKELDLSHSFIHSINELDEELHSHFSNALSSGDKINRKLVSFQANKNRSAYRWFKFKEAFSADLVELMLREYSVPKGKILDPFAGAGTALFAASDLGYESDGIELLPVGQKIIEAREFGQLNLEKATILEELKKWKDCKPWKHVTLSNKINTLRITEGAYSEKTIIEIEKYIALLESANLSAAILLKFVLLCVLESISYTRKDGQYLRWDYRSSKENSKKTFNKGRILSFDEAISKKLEEVIMDIEHPKGKTLSLFKERVPEKGRINLIKGSCLDILPKLKHREYNAIITSPPYCNRYDYTRTYALELALLGVSEQELMDFRQSMISCTVENRAKELIKINKNWSKAISIVDDLTLLQTILDYLEFQKQLKNLNNNGIPRMVRGYFYEMACVIQECYRVLEENSFLFMVNDNVRYAGIPIHVDLLLSKIAESIGFKIENILVLPQAKGNSSQQMGVHGRFALRKCVYVWRKTI